MKNKPSLVELLFKKVGSASPPNRFFSLPCGYLLIASMTLTGCLSDDIGTRIGSCPSFVDANGVLECWDLGTGFELGNFGTNGCQGVPWSKTPPCPTQGRVSHCVFAQTSPSTNVTVYWRTSYYTNDSQRLGESPQMACSGGEPGEQTRLFNN